jgi:hypothetical protein
MTTRRLAAILAADMVGFSSLMGRDEEGTLGRIKSLRREVIEPKVKEHHGRIFKTAGDGFLAPVRPQPGRLAYRYTKLSDIRDYPNEVHRIVMYAAYGARDTSVSESLTQQASLPHTEINASRPVRYLLRLAT